MSNEWMTLARFVYNFWFTCKKGSVKANRTKQKQKIHIVFGPDQRKWTSWLSWCEYTFSKQASVDYHNKNKIFSAAKC